MTMSPNCIVTSQDEFENQATELAQHLALPYVKSLHKYVGFCLELTSNGLELHHSERSKEKPLKVDFLAGTNYHRYRFGGGKHQHIARAVGLKHGLNPMVLDITAGLGRDGFILATLGCQVTLIERNPIVWALVDDAIKRANSTPWFHALKLKLINNEAVHYLSQANLQQSPPDVIYCDPMFPENKNSALVKKEMRILRQLVGDDLDTEDALELSLQVASKRVVVKRHIHAPFLNTRTPSLQIKGKSSRYDVYLCSPQK